MHFVRLRSEYLSVTRDMCKHKHLGENSNDTFHIGKSGGTEDVRGDGGKYSECCYVSVKMGRWGAGDLRLQNKDENGT